MVRVGKTSIKEIQKWKNFLLILLIVSITELHEMTVLHVILISGSALPPMNTVVDTVTGVKNSKLRMRNEQAEENPVILLSWTMVQVLD